MSISSARSSNHVVRVDAGRLAHYPGGYQYYLDKTAAASPESGAAPVAGAASPNPPAKSARKEQKRLEAEQRQALSAGRKNQRALVAKLEAEILQLETRQKELTADLENPAIYQLPGKARDINLEWPVNSAHLEKLSREWEQAAGQALAAEQVTVPDVNQ